MNLEHVKDQIFIFDLHNTLYDEVSEYGLAMKATTDYLLEYLPENYPPNKLYAQIAKAHADAGSDWDNDIWFNLEVFKHIEDKDTHIEAMRAIRAQQSKILTVTERYDETIEAIKLLKSNGARLFLATEATANAAADSIRWLEIDGLFEAVYSWPYNKHYEMLSKTPQRVFPQSNDSDLYVQKPHVLIIAQIIFDMAVDDGAIPQGRSLADFFDLIVNESLDVSELEAKLPSNHVQATEALKAIQTKLEIKASPYADIIKGYMKRCHFVGDSFFKDGFLAMHADVPFIHAGYGKKVRDAQKYEQAKQILFAVTGWEPFLLQLTQEASQLPNLMKMIKPRFTCENSFMDFITDIESKADVANY